MRRTGPLATAVALALLIGACSGGADDAAPATTTAARSTTSLAPNTTTEQATTAVPSTTGGSATTASAAPTTVPADPITGNIEGVVVYEGLSQDHVDGNVDYDVRPPVGGAHAARWLTCGVYDAPVDEEMAVHSLEHGAVWITYDADALATDAITRIYPIVKETFAEDPDRIAWVLVSPYSPMPAPLVVSAWGRQLVLEDVADPRLVAFMLHFANGPQNPEPGAPC